jgi:adenylate kinase
MILVLFGAPGSGKGTLASNLIKKFPNLVSISPGNLLREAVKAQNALGKQVEACLKRGELVPDDLVTGMVIEQMDASQKDFLLDGFPRTVNQAQSLDEYLQKKSKKIDNVVHIKIQLEDVISRLTGRLICPQCYAIYHVKNHPPQKSGHCDLDGSKLDRRNDDESVETITKRYYIYRAQTKPVIEYYKKHWPTMVVRGEDSSDEIVKKVTQKIEKGA